LYFFRTGGGWGNAFGKAVTTVIDGQSLHSQLANAVNPKFEIRSTKWFDQPFDRLTVLSRVEGLTTLSQVEGQIQNPNSPMFKTEPLQKIYLEFGSFEFGTLEFV
jgi:hypothetical protein